MGIIQLYKQKNRAKNLSRHYEIFFIKIGRFALLKLTRNKEIILKLFFFVFLS